jgi:hypothetical protein
MPEREGLLSLKVRVECVCVTLLEPSQGSGESCAHVLFCACVRVPLFFRPCPRTVPACSFYSLKEVQGYKMLVHGRSLLEKQPQGLGGPYPVATLYALWRHGVGTSGTPATWLGMRAIVEGVVSVFRYCSDVPRHSWSCSWRGLFVLVV